MLLIAIWMSVQKRSEEVGTVWWGHRDIVTDKIDQLLLTPPFATYLLCVGFPAVPRCFHENVAPMHATV